jgi:signal transduction histidine kinase
MEQFEGVLTKIVQSLDFPDAGAILLVSRRSGTVQEQASVGFASPDSQEHQVTRELGEECIAKGMALCRHLDGELVEFFPDELVGQQRCRERISPVCTISLPLTTQHKVIGSLALNRDRCRGGGALTYEESTIILGAAQQLGRSIENSRLYQEAQEREKRLGEMLHQVVGAQEAERKRIALELHDATGQSLTAVALGLSGIETMLATDPSIVTQQVQELKSYSMAALGELRRIIADLRPSQLDDLGLVAAIEWYLQEFEKLYGISTHFECGEERRRLPAEYETVLFRIIQEGLTNIAKHAQATRATVRLEIRPVRVIVAIEDNGRGFDPDSVLQRDQPAGWGLMGIQERALLLGGECELDSAPGSGTRIRVSVSLVMERKDVQDSTLTR